MVRPRVFAAVLMSVAACRPTPTPPPSSPPAEPATSTAPGSKQPHAERAPSGTQIRTRPQPSAVNTRAAALKAATHGNPEGARDFLLELLAKQPDDLQARHALSRAWLTLGAIERAMSTLESAPTTDPLTLRMRAELLVRTGKLEQADRLLTDAIQDAPAELTLRGDLISIRVARGREQDSATQSLMDTLYDAYEADRAQSAAELHAVAQAALGRGTKGALHDANMVFGEAEQLARTQDPAGWELEAIVLRRAEMFRRKYAAEDALQTYAVVLEGRDEWHPDALAGAARVHADNLAFAEASRVATEVLAVDPEHPDAHAVLARIALVEGRRVEARTRIQQHVLLRNPTHTSGLATLAALAWLGNAGDDYKKWRDSALLHNPHNGEFFVELADLLGFLHLYPEIREVLEEGQTHAPDDPHVLAAYGLNLLRLGDETRALDALDRAWQRDPFNERTRNTLDLFEQRIEPNYSISKLDDFTVRLPTQDRSLLEPVLAKSAVRAKQELDTAYSIKVAGLRLEFFSNTNDFSIRTVGVPSLGAVAVCFGPVITFVGPYSGRFNVANVIRHEMAHVYAISLSKGRVPRWFTEGLSEWESELENPAFARESAKLLQAARRAGRLRRLHDMELAFVRAENPQMMEVAYATAAYAIRYLGQTYGRDKLVAMLRGYASGANTETLMKQHLGKSLAEIDVAFERWFIARLDEVVTGWRPRPDPQLSRQLPHDARERLFAGAQAAISKRNAKAATIKLRELLRADGDGYAPRMMLARLVPNEARTHLEAARGFDREAVEPLVELANLARKQDRPDDEKRHLADALAIDADAFEPAARALMLAVVSADTTLETTARTRARNIAPLHPASLAAEALAELQAGRAQQARHYAQSAAKRLRDAEGPADTFVLAALACSATGDTNQARTLAKQALRSQTLPSIAKARIEPLAQP